VLRYIKICCWLIFAHICKIGNRTKLVSFSSQPLIKVLLIANSNATSQIGLSDGTPVSTKVIRERFIMRLTIEVIDLSCAMRTDSSVSRRNEENN